jgi:transcriptional regulator with XRE-family HTH domain
MALSFAEKMKIILGRRSMTFVDLAKTMGVTRQNISNKISKNNFSENEMKKIAEILNCKYESPVIIMNDTGEEV